MEIRHVVHTFPPVIDKNCETLILGSVPSVRSSAAGFYYMHPQNRFWRVMGLLLGAELAGISKEQKTEILLSKRIALYDSVYECDILGSSDTKIEHLVPSDIPKLIETTNIKRIFTNGTASYEIFAKAHPDLLPITQKLPSTSPANASFGMEKLLESWKIILK